MIEFANETQGFACPREGKGVGLRKGRKWARGRERCRLRKGRREEKGWPPGERERDKERLM